jgi:hypothetical protein
VLAGAIRRDEELVRGPSAVARLVLDIPPYAARHQDISADHAQDRPIAVGHNAWSVGAGLPSDECPDPPRVADPHEIVLRVNSRGFIDPRFPRFRSDYFGSRRI